MERTPSLYQRSASILLAAVLLILPAVQSSAQVVSAAAVPAGASRPAVVVPVGTGRLASAPLTFSGTMLETGGLPVLGGAPTIRTRAGAPSFAAHPSAAAKTPKGVFGASAIVPNAEAAPAGSPAEAISAQGALEGLSDSLRDPQGSERSPEGSAAILSRGFDAALRRGASDDDAVPAAAATADAGLAPRAAGSAKPEAALPVPAPQPKRSLERALKYGLLMALASTLLLRTVSPFVEAFGYVAHPNFPAFVLPITVVGYDLPIVQGFHTTVVAPIVEEAVYRAGLMGGVKKALSWIRGPAGAVVGALVSSVVFVLIHETADPLFMVLRGADALLFSWTYEREGYTAAVAMHSVRNILELTFAAWAAPSLGAAALLLRFLPVLAVAAGFAVSWFDIQEQRAARADGRIARYRMSPGVASFMAALMLFGSLLIAPDMLKLAGPFIVGLLLYAWRLRTHPPA